MDFLIVYLAVVIIRYFLLTTNKNSANMSAEDCIMTAILWPAQALEWIYRQYKLFKGE